jgi:hypothetical protein
MRIGHIDLSAHIGAAEEQLVVLVEALGAHDIEQYVLVRNPFLAKRLSVCEGVTVGPVVRSAVSAYFLMPAVDLVHTHEAKAVSAAIMLNLTRSAPYIVAHRRFSTPASNPIRRWMYRRAAGIICPSENIASAMLDYLSETPVDTIADARNTDDEIDADNGRICAAKMAAENLRVYRRILDNRGVPAMLL